VRGFRVDDEEEEDEEPASIGGKKEGGRRTERRGGSRPLEVNSKRSWVVLSLSGGFYRRNEFRSADPGASILRNLSVSEKLENGR